MKYIILQKAKPYTRIKGGKLERVRGYPGRQKVYHGTSIGVIRNILEEGLKASKYHNWDSRFYSGKRKNKVFVTKSFENAIIFGEVASGGNLNDVIIVEAKIPKDYWRSNMKPDEKTDGNILPSVNPEWITNIYDVEGDPVTKRFDSLRLERFHKFRKADEDMVKVYIPLSEVTLRKIIKEEAKNAS